MKEEYLYHVDENDKVIGKISRREVVEKKIRHRSTAIFTFNSKGEILVHKRTMTKDAYPGYYDMSNGGSVTYGESYDESAVREIEEEIGVRNAQLKFLFKHIYAAPSNKTIIYVYKLIHDGPFMFQEEEVEFGKFMTLKELQTMLDKENFCPDSRQAFERYLGGQREE